MIQCDKSNYKFERYVLADRWLSYYYQIKEAVKSNEIRGGAGLDVCTSYLIIGKGDGIVPDVIKRVLLNMTENEKIIVDSFDFDPELNPTYTGDVRDIASIVPVKYECVICCQVLEHLEWKYFEHILKQIRSICTKRLILSLPMHRIPFAIFVETPWFIKSLRVSIQKSWKKSIRWNGQHYWEVGIKGHRKKDIIKIIAKYFNVKRDYVAPGVSYHWFVITERLDI